MNSRNIGIGILGLAVLGIAIFGGAQIAQRFFSREPRISESAPSQTINPYAQVSAEGHPLPSEAREDLLIEITDSSPNADYKNAKVLYDYDTGEYELVAFDELGLLNIVYADNQHYAFDEELEVWYKITAQESENFFDIKSVYFDQPAVDTFLKTAVYVAQAECGTVLCSSWQALYGNEEIETLNIRVENQTRKIFDINGIGGESSYTLRYKYQNVDIEPPSPVEDLQI